MGSTRDSQQFSLEHRRENLPLLLQSGWTGHLIAQRVIQFGGILWTSALIMSGKATSILLAGETNHMYQGRHAYTFYVFENLWLYNINVSSPL